MLVKDGMDRVCARSRRGCRQITGQNSLMTPESTDVDYIDQRILSELATDGRMSWKELGERVHLAPTSVADRVRRLERDGVITGYRAVIDPGAVGRSLRAVVDLSLAPGASAEEFESRLAERSEVVFAAYVTGTADYTVVAECAGADGLDDLVRWLRADLGVARTESSLILRVVVGD